MLLFVATFVTQKQSSREFCDLYCETKICTVKIYAVYGVQLLQNELSGFSNYPISFMNL